jgi:predicted small integral membrane protein
MKKNVIKFGVLAGAIATAWMVGSIAWCHETGTFEGNMMLGFASMIIAFSLMFPAVKGYRDNQNNGIISFGKAFKMGLFIALIGSSIYVAAWLIDYYFFVPDFMERLAHQLTVKAQNSGKSPAEIADKLKEIDSMKKIYNSIFGVIMYTYLEILPTGIIIALITALVLKRKVNNHTISVA